MGLYDRRPCPCGSGKDSSWVNDARGIPVARVCDDCEETRLSYYRKDIFTNPNYACDEPIEEDQW